MSENTTVDTSKPRISSFTILDLQKKPVDPSVVEDYENGANGVEAQLVVTFENVFNDLSKWKNLKDILFGKYDFERDGNNKIVIKDGAPAISQSGYYSIDINNTSVWQELTSYEQDIARRLFGIYVPHTVQYENEDGTITKEEVLAYTGSFLDKKAIVVQDTPVQDINGNWYFPAVLGDNGELQYEDKSAIEKFYKIPNYEMKEFKREGEDPVYYPVKSEGKNEVSQEFAEYLYDSLNTSSMVQDILMYSRFWNTFANEHWTDETTHTIVSKGEIESMFPDSVVSRVNGGT